ncbi:MAG: redoxin domain-containing protein [Candidatus Kariarchaeaceae archaeon]|jgi:peroxiredoxin
MVNIGDMAPAVNMKFSSQDVVNQNFNLQEAYDRGTTILYFFPAAFTGVCTKSSCEIRDKLSDFTSINTQIYGVSTDMSFTLKKFIEENSLNYPILSDWNKEAISAFGIVDDNFAGGLTGVSKRSLFLVKDGRIAYEWVAETPGNYPPFDEVKALL